MLTAKLGILVCTICVLRTGITNAQQEDAGQANSPVGFNASGQEASVTEKSRIDKNGKWSLLESKWRHLDVDAQTVDRIKKSMFLCADSAGRICDVLSTSEAGTLIQALQNSSFVLSSPAKETFYHGEEKLETRFQGELSFGSPDRWIAADGSGIVYSMESSRGHALFRFNSNDCVYNRPLSAVLQSLVTHSTNTIVHLLGVNEKEFKWDGTVQSAIRIEPGIPVKLAFRIEQSKSNPNAEFKVSKVVEVVSANGRKFLKVDDVGAQFKPIPDNSFDVSFNPGSDSSTCWIRGAVLFDFGTEQAEEIIKSNYILVRVGK